MTLTLTKNFAKCNFSSFKFFKERFAHRQLLLPLPASMAAVWKSEHSSSLSKLLLFLNSKEIFYYHLVRFSLPTLSSFLHAQFADLLLCHRVVAPQEQFHPAGAGGWESGYFWSTPEFSTASVHPIIPGVRVRLPYLPLKYNLCTIVTFFGSRSFA